MKITFIRSNTNAVGEYRVRHPYVALSALGHECRLITLKKGNNPVCNADIVGDILVLQRQHTDDAIRLRNTIPPHMRPTLVYEVDDNPWEWHSWDPIHVELGQRYASGVTNVMAQCDGITCSTTALAQRIRQEFPGKPIWVIPNAIDTTIRDWGYREDRAEHGLAGKLVLGWTGSLHHTEDAGELLQALPTVLERLDALFLMQCDRSVYYSWTKRLHSQYRDRLRWIPPLPFDCHPPVYSLFDINLAPLANTRFNQCKSDLRLIEGGAHSVPYVASNFAPYAELHRQTGGIGGKLARTAAEWVESICSVALQREAMGRSLQTYVYAARTLTVTAGMWQSAYQNILDGRSGDEVRHIADTGRNSLCPCGSGKKRKKCCKEAFI